MRTRALELLAATTLLAGCPSTTVYRTAETVPNGEFRGAVALGGGVLRDRAQDTRAPTGHVELELRRGVSANADVGVKLFTVGVDASATLRFLRRDAWSLALAPQLTFVRTPETALTTNAIHLFGGTTFVATRRLGPSTALSFGPAIGFGMYFPEAGGHVEGLFLGTFVNFELALGKRTWLVPELSGFQVVSGEVPVRGAGVNLGASLRFGL